MGLEPTTTRLRALCSAAGARRAVLKGPTLTVLVLIRKVLVKRSTPDRTHTIRKRRERKQAQERKAQSKGSEATGEGESDREECREENCWRLAAGATALHSARRWHHCILTPKGVLVKSTARGFEPLRAEPNGFRVHLLNRLDTLSWVLAFGKQISFKESLSTNPSKAGKKTCFSNNRFHWCGNRNNAHAGGRARVTSLGGLYDAATIRAPMQHGQNRIPSALRQ